MLKEHYVVEKDWLGKKYCGIALDWNTNWQKVHLSMPDYCNKGLTRFRHEARKFKYRPHQHAAPVYGAKIQYAKPAHTSIKLGAEDNKFIQQVTGMYLYYVRGVDASMLLVLNVIGPYRRNNEENIAMSGIRDYTSRHHPNVR